MEYDAILVLAHELNQDKTPSEQTRQRVDKSLELFKEGKAKTILMSGGQKDFGARYGISLAEAMKKYAIGKGSPEETIFKEDASWETVGQLFFCKVGVIDVMRWKRLLIVSHSYHLPRVRTISKIVFDRSYQIDFAGIDTGDGKGEEEKERLFLSTFGEIRPGDDKQFEERLFTKHEIYSSSSEAFKDRLEQVKSRVKNLQNAY